MSVSGKVELAHEPDFVMGRLTVSPSRRELVRDDGQREVLEHRVMQVLIALSKAEGSIVTRHELTMLCWNGQVVGENAIHRVISRLRKVANGIGAGSIEIETITKIGYRLTKLDSQSDRDANLPGHGTLAGPTERVTPRLSRRNLVLAAGSAAIFGGGAYLYRRQSEASVPSNVQALVAQARQLRDQSTREAQYQAIGLLQHVVTIAPDYADGWGMLGCAYAVPSHYREQEEGIALRARAESAAQRALALDPGNGYGELALSVALPFIGHWMERDRHLNRALSDRPDEDEILAFRAAALIFVGRAKEALSYYAKVRHKPFTPAVYNDYIRALWSAGMVEETDRAMDDAAALYPTQGTIWITRFHVKMFSGKPDAAIALAEDPKGRPSDIDGPTLPAWIAQARAIGSGNPEQRELVSVAQMERARVSSFGAESAIRVLSALGRVDQAFEVAGAYYFGRGFIVPDSPAPGSKFTPGQRHTRLLFEPVTRSMRADARFEPLVEEIGLDRYWRQSGVQPDYRRP
ncbi:winged helix-turn-helix domain-containing protein [Sphingomonas edaphi]|uniref:OmpR/PhoB-type domain-containing protein n=1 Tax=Sphingomonas edaphi TaxID=2315689 RepID=A0A418PYQ9_9SPHN|nr:winged helix-turn-helix domain-containing protein [Sphingomonas edaphi]RIX27125.1 hypothetical protein D3M59_11285 [Sphingomonas edaphi]